MKNKHNQTPIDLAASTARGEVLNALLLACAGEGKSAVAVAALRALLAAGAVPDTWAPNGSSALMLAAAADGVTALQVWCRTALKTLVMLLVCDVTCCNHGGASGAGAVSDHQVHVMCPSCSRLELLSG